MVHECLKGAVQMWMGFGGGAEAERWAEVVASVGAVGACGEGAGDSAFDCYAHSDS